MMNNMYAPTEIDVDKQIVMKGPNPVSFDDDMHDGQNLRYINPTLHYKQLKLKISGKITRDLSLDKFNNYTCMFKPNSSQLPNLEKLESIFERNKELKSTFGIPDEYNLVFTIGETDSNIRIKYMLDKYGIPKAECDTALTIDEHLKQATSGTITDYDVVVSYYFNDEKKTYGMTLRLLETHYNPIADVTKIKPTKKKSNK